MTELQSTRCVFGESTEDRDFPYPLGVVRLRSSKRMLVGITACVLTENIERQGA
jgi:hypothetical protein